jgi:Tetratricopeptide repeat
MGSKTYSPEREGEHWQGLPASPPVSVEEACQLHERAVALREHGQHAEAEALYQRALPLFEQALGPSHPHVEICLRNYARLLRDMQRRAEVRTLEARARQVRHTRRANQ